jgi:hypothetical protein
MCSTATVETGNAHLSCLALHLSVSRHALPLRPPRSSPGRRRRPNPERELPTTHVLQPNCNRASTRWYTIDKVTPPDHRKPPKQARFPDTLGRTRTYASKLIAGAGQRFESARRLSIFGLDKPNTRDRGSRRLAVGSLSTSPVHHHR